MAYTNHGHWVGPGEPSIPRPPMARCGGLFVCTQCRHEATEILATWMSNKDWRDDMRTGVSALNFGQALAALQAGRRVTRESWGNPDTWLIIVPGSIIPVSAGRPLGIAAPDLIGSQLEYRAHIDKRNADGSIGPWNPSTCALLADDWMLV